MDQTSVDSPIPWPLSTIVALWCHSPINTKCSSTLGQDPYTQSNMSSTVSCVTLLAVDATLCLEFVTVGGIGTEEQDLVPGVLVLELVAVRGVLSSISMPSDFGDSLGLESFHRLPHAELVEN